MKGRGSVSVFLALTCTCMISLVLLMLEGARTAGARWQAQNVAFASMDSLFSEYNKKMWERYRICLLEYLGEQDIRDCLEQYAKDYAKGSANYRLHSPEFSLADKRMITDEGGAYLEREILALMPLHILGDAPAPPNPEELLETMQSAQARASIGEELQEIAALAMDLEAYFIPIARCLERINKGYRNAGAALEEEDIGDFCANAEDLLKGLEDLEKSFQRYEEKAGQTQERIDRIYTEKAEQWQLVRGGDKSSLEEYTRAYTLYKEEQAGRLKESRDIVQAYTTQRAPIEESLKNAEEILYLEEQQDEDTGEDDEEAKQEEESEDEEDYTEEIQALYEQLRQQWSLLQLSAKVEITEADEEKKAQLYALQESMQGGLLDLVLSPGEVCSSKEIAEGIDLASRHQKSRSLPGLNIAERLIIQEYTDRFFTDFTGGQEGILNYEKEYLLAGQLRDRANLAAAVQEIWLLRSGLNAAHIVQSEAKMAQVRALAATIMGVCGLPQLSVLCEFFLVGLWSTAEAAVDVRCLLSGKEVPFFKTEKDFYLRIENLFQFSEALEASHGAEKEEGFFRYGSYLKICLLFRRQEELNYRMLDVMQLNVSTGEHSIQMQNMLYALATDMKIHSRSLFSPLAYEEGKSYVIDGFYIKIHSVRAYH